MTFSQPIDVVLFILEVFGCLSFGTSGAIKAFHKKADVLGVIILCLIETFGGGLLRDLIISQGIPHIFWDPEYLILAIISIGVSLFWFFLAYNKKTAAFVQKHSHDFWIDALDAVGIAVFAICGVRVADASIANSVISRDNVVGVYVYIITLGVITGVGGGMFRDLFTNEIPMVFRKHFYMTPCIIGSVIFAVMYETLGKEQEILSIAVSCIIIIALRILAVVFRWNLPKAKGFNELEEKHKKE